MATSTIRLAPAASVLVLASSLAGCSSADNDAAEAAYNACVNDAAETQIMRLDGDTVYLEVTGDAARAYAGTDDEIEDLGNEDAGMDGIMVMLSVVTSSQCMAEETGYPGSYDQLSDGEEWDGWRYHEQSGAGSEVTFAFESLG